jgi:ubiquitin C-terminal hydrolase
MSTKYLTNEHQDMNEYLVQSLELLHDKLRERSKDSKGPAKDFYSSPLASLLAGRPDTPQAQELKASLLDLSSQAVREPRLVYPARAEELTNEAWAAYLTREQSPVVDELDGMLTRVRVCPNGHSSHSFETFRIFSLNFSPGGVYEREARATAEKAERELQRIMGQEEVLNDRPPPKNSLARFFDQLQLPEFVELKCEQCGDAAGDQRFVQVSYISRFPHILLLHLARFRSLTRSTWGAQKIHTHVDFPVNGLTFYQSNGDAIVYDLVAVVNHSGTFSKGHYYTFVRPSLVTGIPTTNQWFKLDDHVVTPISSVVTPNAYMLMYIKREVTPSVESE